MLRYLAYPSQSIATSNAITAPNRKAVLNPSLVTPRERQSDAAEVSLSAGLNVFGVLRRAVQTYASKLAITSREGATEVA